MGSYFQNQMETQLKRADGIRNRIKLLMDWDVITDHENDILALVYQEELLCLELRSFVRSVSVECPAVFDERLASILDYKVERKGNGYVITLPSLRHRQKSRENMNYIVYPLFSVLDKFNEQSPVTPFKKAQITVCHCYVPGLPRYALPDYDNLELKKVIDVLATFFLIDDNWTRFDLVQTSRESEKACTEITVFPMAKNAGNTVKKQVEKTAFGYLSLFTGRFRRK